MASSNLSELTRCLLKQLLETIYLQPLKTSTGATNKSVILKGSLKKGLCEGYGVRGLGKLVCAECSANAQEKN